MTSLTAQNGQLFTLPYTQPLSVDGKILPSHYRVFYYQNSTTLAPIFQDAALTTAYTQPVYASTNGLMPPVYLNPSVEYRSQLFNAAGQLLEDCDHVNNNTAGTPFIVGFQKSAVKLTTTTVTNNVTLTVDPDLQVNIPGAGVYKIDLDLVMTAGAAGATPGISLYLQTYNVNTSDQSSLPVMGAINSVLAALPLPYAGASPLNLSLGTTGVSNTVRFSGTVQTLNTGTSPGYVKLYWCQQNFSSQPTSILAGSSLNVLQVA